MAPRILALLAGVAMLAAAPVFAETEPALDPIDPKARELLGQMVDFLKGLEAYEIEARLEWESIQDSGLKLQFGSQQQIVVSRPDRLFVATRRDDGRARKAWFSGGVLTSLDVGENVYTRSEVGKDLSAMLDWAEARGATPSPLVDFLYPDIEASFMPSVEAGVYVGTSFVGDVASHHLAFRTAEIDYQLWVRAEGDPIPLRYTITSKTVPSSPWFSARFLRWELDPPLDGFTPQLPEGAREIERVPPPTEPDEAGESAP